MWDWDFGPMRKCWQFGKSALVGCFATQLPCSGGTQLSRSETMWTAVFKSQHCAKTTLCLLLFCFPQFPLLTIGPAVAMKLPQHDGLVEEGGNIIIIIWGHSEASCIVCIIYLSQQLCTICLFCDRMRRIHSFLGKSSLRSKMLAYPKQIFQPMNVW